MVYVDAKSCEGCGLCVEACPHGAIKLENGVAVVERNRCHDTGACLEACPQGALLSLIEPEEKQYRPLPARVAPPVKQAAPLLASQPRSLGTWLGAALGFLVSDVLPELLRYRSDRRPRRAPDSIPMGLGRCGGTQKLRRRQRRGCRR